MAQLGRSSEDHKSPIGATRFLERFPPHKGFQGHRWGSLLEHEKLLLALKGLLEAF